MYASHKLNDQIALGLGVYVPFGSGTDYDEQSVLRYNLNKLGLQTMALQPTVAFKLNDHHSFGFELINDEIAGHLPLLVITPAHAEHIVHLTLGDERVGRPRGDGENTRVVVNLRGRHGRR